MKIAVIGGGASGIASAIYAKRINVENSVTVFERSDRILKKLLATGNGRCNLSNTSIKSDNYFSSNQDLLETILLQFKTEEEKAFFESIGIPFCVEDGRIYPYSRRAAAVLDALRFECEHLKIKIVTNAFINKIEKNGNGFYINKEYFDKVILSVGGASAPSFGTDGNGLGLIFSLGHSVKKFTYALSPVKVKENTKPLKGIRAKGTVTLLKNKKCENGEIQFTDYGLSGIAVMQLSRNINAGDVISLDLMPETEKTALFDMLTKRKALLSHLEAQDFLTGFLHKALSQYILSLARVDFKSSVRSLNDKDILAICDLIKSLSFTAKELVGKEQSQASAGGARLCDFNPITLESLKCPNLYCTGELLDAVGDCGGYNLHWAWTTAYIAGRSAGGQNA